MKTMCVVAVLFLASAGVPAFGQLKTIEADVPRIPDEQRPTQAIAWAIAAIASAGILLVAFKNSKRNHMD